MQLGQGWGVSRSYSGFVSEYRRQLLLPVPRGGPYATPHPCKTHSPNPTVGLSACSWTNHGCRCAEAVCRRLAGGRKHPQSHGGSRRVPAASQPLREGCPQHRSSCRDPAGRRVRIQPGRLQRLVGFCARAPEPHPMSSTEAAPSLPAVALLAP